MPASGPSRENAPRPPPARRRFLASLGLGPRLAGAFLLVALLSLAAGGGGLLGLARAADAARVLDQSAGMIQAVQEVRVAFGALRQAPSAYLISGDPAAPERFAAAVAEVRARLAGYAAAHSLHRHSAAHAVSAHELIAATSADLDAIERLGQSVFSAPDRESAAARLAELETLQAGAITRLEQLLVNAEDDVAAARVAYTSAQRGATVALAIGALLAFALAAGLAWYSTRRLTGPLAALAQSTDRIAAGDLATPVDVPAPGELGLLAAAFERMRRMLVHERERARRLAILEERDRIGREMHDGLAQVLGFVNTKAQAVREYLRAGQPEPAAQQVDELISAAREAYTDAREAIDDLRLDGAEHRPLADLLAERVERFQRQAGIQAELTVELGWQESGLSPTARVQVVRIVQEALTNIRKHSGAQHAQVCLGVEAGPEQPRARVRISDDGTGFHLSRLLSPEFSRYGLRTMRERAQAVGGTFRIESMPGEGTRIIIHLPLSQPEDEADHP